jgi:hypothetical protein
MSSWTLCRPAGFGGCPHNDGWLEIAWDYGGESWAVDLDPDLRGTSGQLIQYRRYSSDPMIWIAPSVLHALRLVVDTLHELDGWYEVGTQLWPPDGIELFADDSPTHEWIVDIGENGVTAAVSTLDDPLLVQYVAMRDVGEVDLADLAALANLRSIQLRDARRLAGRVSFTLPSRLQVESLRLWAAHFDLSAIPPTVWSLALADNVTAVWVEPLLHSGLLRLDVAEATVADIECLVRYPTVRVLVLNAAQWKILRAGGFAPSTLAAASLGEHVTLADAVDWSNWAMPEAPVRREIVRGHLGDTLDG